MAIIVVVILAFVLITALPMYAFYRPYRGGRNRMFTLALIGLGILLLIGLGTWSYTQTPYYRTYYYRPVEVVNPAPVQVIDQRPITVINPAPNSGEGVKIVPGSPVVPTP